ncbi:hypothetical protein MRX96_003509 [Rhipicephalus microplus]
MCQKENQPIDDFIASSGDDSEQELSLGNLTVDIVESASSDWFECVEVNGHLVNFKLNTGSDVNILPEQLVLNWNPQSTVKATNAKVTTYLDALSHAPDPAETIKTSDQEYQVLACTLVPASTPKLAEIRTCTAADSTLQCVASYIQKGWSNKISKVPTAVKPYYSMRVDYYSKYAEIKKMRTTSASSVITVLKDIYACFGIPSEVVSDQGPPFDSAHFRNFNKEWDIVHKPTSPRFPRANGQVERTIQTIKASMTKALSEGKELAVVLLNHRATPMNGLLSPAEMLRGRRIRTFIPAHLNYLLPHYPHSLLQRNLQSRQQAQHKHADQHARQLPSLTKNTPVWFWQGKKWEKALLTQVGPEPRRYIVTAASGQVYMRNRHHLRVRHSPSDPQSTPEEYYPLQTTKENVPHHTSHPSSLPDRSSDTQKMPPQPFPKKTRSGRPVRIPSRFFL